MNVQGIPFGLKQVKDYDSFLCDSNTNERRNSGQSIETENPRDIGQESFQTNGRASHLDNNQSIRSSVVGAKILSGLCVLEKGTVSRTKGFENIETDEIARDPKS